MGDPEGLTKENLRILTRLPGKSKLFPDNPSVTAKAVTAPFTQGGEP